jgi:hypothetical protein
MLKNIAGALLCLFLLSFCKRANTTWDDDVVTPLAMGNLTLGNLFPDTVIKANVDSSLKIAFTSTLINYGLDSLLKIPDTTITTVSTNTFSAVFSITPGEPLFANANTSTQYNFPNGIQLKKAIVKQGKLKIVMYNSVNDTLVYNYQLPSATKNGVALSQTFIIPKRINPSTPGTLTANLDLAGYTVDFTGTGNQINTIIQNGQINVAPSSMAHNDSLYPNQGLISNFTFTDIVPQYALGYFGSQSITVGPDTTAFTAFSAIKQGMLNLNSAQVTLTINNQFGVGMSAVLSNILSINTNIPNTVALNAVPLSSAVNISSAANTGTGATTVTKIINLDDNNSNVKYFIGNLPGKLAYKLKAQLNPYGNLSGSNDFGYYGTAFSANLNMDVPLFFSASNLMLADTVGLDLSGVGQLKNINHGNLILTATNSYPFSINLSAVLLDAGKHVIDNLFSSPSLIEAPLLDANNKVTAPLKSKLYVPLTPQRISNLQKAKYIYYTATFNTANQPNQIKFYSNYTLGLVLTADFNYTIGK